MIVIWISIFLLAKWQELDKRLSSSERKIYLLIVISYPFLETIIKYFLINNLIEKSWFWINRIEHFLSALAIEMLFYPFLKPTINKLNTKEAFIFIVCVIAFIGSLNEFLEYFIRYLLGTYQVSHFYWDTIYDMVMNIFGAVTGFLILNRSKGANMRHTLRHSVIIPHGLNKSTLSNSPDEIEKSFKRITIK